MKRLTSRKGEQGVTLVELMIVVAILGMVMAATYNMFNFQQKSYTIQDNVAVMQQNVRVGLDYMVKEVRMAGYIPEDIPPYNAGPTNDSVTSPSFTTDGNNEDIEEATYNALTFQADIDDDNRTETVRYALNGTNLTREVWEWSGGAWTDEDGLAAPQIVAENIVIIAFTYTGVMPNGDDDNGDGQTDEDGELGVWDINNGNIDDDNDGDSSDENGALNTQTLREGIRQITISMTAIAGNPDADYTHPQFGDHFRRRTLTSNAYLRNSQ
jgi:type IV pilus assembly protein PilW